MKVVRKGDVQRFRVPDTVFTGPASGGYFHGPVTDEEYRRPFEVK
jgi:hypothetical protein